MTQKHCVVIGAGLAGLAAAYELTQRHWRVTVLEASNRLGGRVKSHHFRKGPGLVCELGGEWIGKDHREMRRLCCLFDLKLIPHEYSLAFWREGRPSRRLSPTAWVFSPELKQKFQQLRKSFWDQGPAGNESMDKLDWWTVLSRIGFNEIDLRKRDLMDSTDFGESIRHISAYVAAAEYFGDKDTPEIKTDEMDDKIDRGNDRLVDSLADAIGRENIEKNFVVREIEHKGGRVAVYRLKWNKGREGWERSGKKRDEIQADYCICAIPSHWLGKIQWTGKEPKRHLAAAAQLQYARITKTAVLCSSRFWTQKGKHKGGFSVFTSLASDFCFDSTHMQEGTKGILCSYSIGDKADDIASVPPNELGGWIAKDVARALYPQEKKTKWEKKAIKAELQAWQKDEFTGGAYAFYRPGQWFTVRPVLRRRFHRVFIAGEHLAEEQGFMEGAVVTGRDAADSVARAARREANSRR